MIANDARTMVYDTLYKYEYDIPQELEDKINEEIIAAAERMKFRCKVELFLVMMNVRRMQNFAAALLCIITAQVIIVI